MAGNKLCFDNICPTYIAGVNLPWLDGAYDHDFGLNSMMDYVKQRSSSVDAYFGHKVNGSYAVTQQAYTNLDKYFTHINSMGASVVRIWAFERLEGLQFGQDGSVTGVDDDMIKNFEKVGALARAQKLRLYVCLTDTWGLWNDNNLTEDEKTKLLGAMNGLITMRQKTISFLEKAVIPILEKLYGQRQNNNALFAVDLLNEPEGLLSKNVKSACKAKWNQNVDSQLYWEQIVDYLNLCASTLKNKFSGIRLSCGLKESDSLKDKLANGKRFSELCSGLSFYDFHAYNNGGDVPKYQDLKLDKPCVIGECGQKADKDEDKKWDDNKQSIAVEGFLKNSQTKGYSGCLVWDYDTKFDPAKKDEHFLSIVDSNGNPRPVCQKISNFTSSVSSMRPAWRR